MALQQIKCFEASSKSLGKELSPRDSSVHEGTLARRFGAQGENWRIMDSNGLMLQKEAKYGLKNWIDEEPFALEFPIISKSCQRHSAAQVEEQARRCSFDTLILLLD
ncbi:hypothetical protein HAX54_023414 [Datura stramonium]|uniref:Uncharacterized protein n=1 Tax=Datura stramonium TaxID=4076 RepID=A0ABS8UWA8_DATST|nr:hypothetical protein [Datura stramonium]